MILKTKLQENLKTISVIINEFISKCRSPEYIEKFKEDNELFDQMCNEMIETCCNTINIGNMSQKEEKSNISAAEKKCSDAIINRLKQLDTDVDCNVIIDDLQEINLIIKDSLEKDSFKLLSDYSEFQNNILDNYRDKIVCDIKEKQKSKINEIIAIVPKTGNIDSARLSLIKTKLYELHDLIKNQISKKDYLKGIINQSIVTDNVSNLKNNIDQDFPTNEKNNSKELVDDFMETYTNNIIGERKDKVDAVFKLNYTTDGTFTKIYPKGYGCPNIIGCGYKNLLFLTDKYRNTILPLITHSGANCIAFSIVNDTTNLKERTEIEWDSERKTSIKHIIPPVEYEVMMDIVSITDYENMWNNLTYIDTNTKWWSNLKEVLIQASIYDLYVVITLQDFSDTNNPFIKDVEEKNRFTDSMWRTNVEEAFYSVLISVIKESKAKVILNLGYGNYTNLDDLDNEKYPMYPTCGYLRKMINFFAYNCKFTSNWMALTANEKQNLYYYNPYCEWSTFDDDNYHAILNGQIITKDYIDEKTNDEAICVSYDEESNIIGGYAKCIIDAEKYSIPIFHMLNLKDRVPVGSDINDPNIMTKIFCYNSRNAIRYFKLKEYFEFKEIEFDENGDVK